jgi:hypothetical protein
MRRIVAFIMLAVAIAAAFASGYMLNSILSNAEFEEHLREDLRRLEKHEELLKGRPGEG